MLMFPFGSPKTNNARECSLQNGVENIDFAADGLHLKETHVYYYQVQAQITYDRNHLLTLWCGPLKAFLFNVLNHTKSFSVMQ